MNIAELKAKIKNANALGITNLTEKGVDISIDATTYEIMSKIAEITSGTGVQPSGPYTKIIYNDNNTLTLVDTENVRHTISYKYDANGKITSLKHNNSPIAISYHTDYPNILKKYGNVKINFGALFGVEIEDESAAILGEDGIVISSLMIDEKGIVSGNMSINDGIVTL